MSSLIPPASPLTVGIAEDSVLLREGLTRILRGAGLQVNAAYDNAEDLLNRIRVEPPDIAIVDIRLPPTHSDSPGPRRADVPAEVIPPLNAPPVTRNPNPVRPVCPVPQRRDSWKP